MRGLLICLAFVAIGTYARSVDRVRREHHDGGLDGWLTEEQKKELGALRAAGNHEEFKRLTMKYYAEQSAEVKAEWDPKYKKHCVAWLKDVASEEELSDLKKLKEAGDSSVLKTKYDAMKERLAGDSRKMVDLWEPECVKLWSDEIKGLSRRRRDIIKSVESLDFLSAEEKAELKGMVDAGKPKKEIADRVIALVLKNKNQDTKEFLAGCYGWIKDVTTDEEYAAFEELHHKDHNACRKKVREFLTRLSDDKKAKIETSLTLCDAVWYRSHEAAGHDHHAHHNHGRKVRYVKRHLSVLHIEKYLHWLTPEQKAEVDKIDNENDSYDKVVAKVKEFYEALEPMKKVEVLKDFKTRCSAWVKDTASEAEMAVINQLSADGKHDELKAKVKELYDKQDEETRHEIDHIKDICLAAHAKKTPSRKRRDDSSSSDSKEEKKKEEKHQVHGRGDPGHAHHGGEHDHEQFLSWLTKEQKEIIAALRADRDAMYKKIFEFWEKTEGDVRKDATEKIKGGCRQHFTELVGAEKVESVKKMKEAGESMEKIKEKVLEYVSTIEDAQKKERAQKAVEMCQKVFEQPARKRRDHHHNHDELTKEWLSWMTDEQKATLEGLDNLAKSDKVVEIYKTLDGEKKTEASGKLKSACRHVLTDLLGEEKAGEIKKVKEAGGNHEAMSKKLFELIESIDDAEKKEKAKKIGGHCKLIYGDGAASRKRRDHAHTTKEIVDNYLQWMTDDQRAEISGLDLQKDREAIDEKILTAFKATDGEKKENAQKSLQNACKHFLAELIGPENSATLKAAKEAGATNQEMLEKTTSIVAGLGDAEKQKKAQHLLLKCKSVYGLARKRRDHQHSVNEIVDDYLKWMSPEDQAEIKALDLKDKEKIEAKVFAAYGTLEGEKKTEATKSLQSACRHFMKELIGEENAGKMKASFEAGAKTPELLTQITDIIGTLEAEKKAKAEGLLSKCKKVYGVDSRKRRDHHHHNEGKVEEYMTGWMNEEQKAEVKALMASEDRSAFYDKIVAIFKTLEGEKKTEAAKALQTSCKHYFTKTFGEEKTAALKALKEAGTNVDEISEKAKSYVADLPEEKRKQATKALDGCKHIFKLTESASRKRREEAHKHTMEEVLTDYLSWLSDAQKEEVKKIDAEGKEDLIHGKVMDYYKALPEGDGKKDAQEKLKGACRHFIKHEIGEEKAAELKKLLETGTTPADMAKHVTDAIAALPEGEKKHKAQVLSEHCKVIYGLEGARLRRHHYYHHKSQL